MKAICVTDARGLEVRDVPKPRDPPPGYLVVRIGAAAINHGDRTFLARPDTAGPALARSRHEVWGASAAGEVIAAGAGVPEGFVGRLVAIYRSVGGGPDTVGLWCQTAQVPWTACLRLPEGTDARDYAGSLVNAFTAYAFLRGAVAAGHRGVIATAGSSATGLALAVLARREGVPALLLVRSAAAKEELEGRGIAEVMVAGGDAEMAAVGERAAALGTTAVFDGVGGSGLGRLLPQLPRGSVVHCYGFLAGAEAVNFPTALLMGKDLTLRRFSNFETPTARDPALLGQAMGALEAVAGDKLLRTRVGQCFPVEAVEAAMDYRDDAGGKAVFVF